MDYDLNRLGDREFEQLLQALLLKALGPGVSVFGAGADGGREAAFDGPIHYEPVSLGPWNGYGVVQMKFHYRPRDTTESKNWLRGRLKQEFEDWLNPASRRGRRPQYFLAVSNVVLSGVSGQGGFDSVMDRIAEYAPRLGLKGWDVWDYGKICRLLDAYPEIARRYYGMIMPGDVLAAMHDFLVGTTGDLTSTLKAHAIRELRADHKVGLDQAGSGDGQGIALPKVAVDLPARLANEDEIAVTAYVIGEGNRVLRPSVGREMRRLVILGGPGQGKTTLAQIICQAYRVALLAGAAEQTLTESVRAMMDEFRGSLGVLGIELPEARRWPVHVHLGQYADAISRDPDLTLLRYIAGRVSKRADYEVTTGHIATWLERWPWLVVLDGLDEVADQRIRDLLLRHVDEFQDTAAERDADLLLVATTRPQGYANEFDPDHFDYMWLSSLKEPAAVQYAERLAEARHADDPDKKDEIVERVRSAAKDKGTARLMRSPLQVTIMSLLLERRRSAPQHRYELFRGYYAVILAREQAKKTAHAELLEQHYTYVETLQEVTGLLLQKRSERQGDAEASLPESELRALASSLLRKEGHESEIADDLAGELMVMALNRLVLLVPLPGGGIGFEVPSLREFMAARALVSGPDSSIVANLQATITSAHWRDTWLLAAGRVFTETVHRHLRGELLTAMRSCDTADALSMTVMPAAHLAVDLLAEGIAEAAPGHETALVLHALDLLRKPPDRYLVRVAEVLRGVIRRNSQAATAVESVMNESMATAGQGAVSVIMVYAVWANGTGTVAGRALRALQSLGDPGGVFTVSIPRQRAALESLQASYPLPSLRDVLSPASAAFEPVPLLPVLEPLLTAQRLDPRTRELAEEVIAVIAETRLLWDRTGDVPVIKVDREYLPDLARLDTPLADADVARAVAWAADNLGLADWPFASLLRSVLGLWKQRQPVGRQLITPDVSGLES